MATGTSGAADPHNGGPRRSARAPGLLVPVVLLAALALHALLWGTEAPLGSWPALGAGVAAAGLGWALWAAVCLWRAGTPVAPGAEPRMLVDEGPFRYGRHPMYLGCGVAIGGLALASGSPLLGLAVPAFMVIVSRWSAHEESMLRRRFGGWYSDYEADVRRWL